MEKNKITGKFEKVISEQSGTSKAGKDWHRAEFLIIENPEGQYPKTIKFSTWKDDILDGVSEGDLITVYFNLTSRQWKEKWFTDAEAYSIKKVPKIEAKDVKNEPPPKELDKSTSLEEKTITPKETNDDSEELTDLPF